MTIAQLGWLKLLRLSIRKVKVWRVTGSPGFGSRRLDELKRQSRSVLLPTATAFGRDWAEATLADITKV
jgi:hypothetical protein